VACKVERSGPSHDWVGWVCLLLERGTVLQQHFDTPFAVYLGRRHQRTEPVDLGTGGKFSLERRLAADPTHLGQNHMKDFRSANTATEEHGPVPIRADTGSACQKRRLLQQWPPIVV
jgi:hypothetical protein